MGYPIAERLRCKYAGRDFSGPAPEGIMIPTPLMLEAATIIEKCEATIESLLSVLDAAEAEIERLSEELATAQTWQEHLLKSNGELEAERNLWRQADLDTRIATGYKRDPRPMAGCAMEMVEGYVRLERALDEIATGPWGETEMRNIAREALKKGDSHDNN